MLRPLLSALAVLAAAAAGVGFSGATGSFDLLLVNARIVDGSGGASYRADVGIRDGRIARIGRLTGSPATRVLDAGGRVASPGFIDVHVHVEESLPAYPDAENLVADGVTTLITGNCGASDPDVGSWLARLSEKGTAVNVATLYGHNTARVQVMGNAARLPTPRELAEMESLVRRAMRQGALGFSTGLIYPPGIFSKPEEAASLAREAGRTGGIYATHMRSENDGVFQSITESIGVARQARVRLEISHFKVTSRRLWGSSARMLALVEAARSEGVDVTLDQYPYAASSSGLEVLLPGWALEAKGAGARHALARRLASRRTRRRMAREMFKRLHRVLGYDDLSHAVVAEAPWDPPLEGKTVSQITQARARSTSGRVAPGAGLRADIATVLEICARGGASGRGPGACGTHMIYHSMALGDVERIFASPLTMVARDGGVVPPSVGNPHPRSFGTSARVLARFVRERGLVSLEEAVRKMTSLPASRFGLRGRGLLREGFWADLVLFDLVDVEDRSTFENPHHESHGFDFVAVNGIPVREEGRPTCERPGRVLYGPGYGGPRTEDRGLRTRPAEVSGSRLWAAVP